MIALASVVAPATPMTTLAVETMPSFAPRTAARSLFMVALDVGVDDVSGITFTIVTEESAILVGMNELIVTILADGLVVPVVLIAAYALIFKVPSGQRYRAYCRVMLAGLTAYLAAKLIGSVYQPEVQRPFELLGVQAGASFLDNPGFPSDHVLFCTALVLAVWFETRNKYLTGILIFLSALVGIGRVVALVHSPLDVIGAVTIACVGVFWYLQRQSDALKRAKMVKT